MFLSILFLSSLTMANGSDPGACERQEKTMREAILEVVNPRFYDEFTALASCIRKCEVGGSCHRCEPGSNYVDTGYGDNLKWDGKFHSELVYGCFQFKPGTWSNLWRNQKRDYPRISAECAPRKKMFDLRCATLGFAIMSSQGSIRAWECAGVSKHPTKYVRSFHCIDRKKELGCELKGGLCLR